MMAVVLWAFLVAVALGWALWRRRAAAALPAPPAPAALPEAAPTAVAQPPDAEALVQLALTHQPHLESAREEAVRALGERREQRARAALRALAEPGATFSTARLRRAAKAALQRLDADLAPTRGQLSLTEGDGRGRLSTAREAGQDSSSGQSSTS